MERIVAFCLRNRLLVGVFVAIVVTAGVRAALTLPIDAVPDITNVQVQVLTSAPALAPLDVERSITFPVEAAMSGMPGVRSIRSVSRFGLSAVTIVFEDGTDLMRARQLVGERLIDARESIPAGLGAPRMAPLSTGLGEVLQFEVRGDGYTPMQLREILDWFISYELRAVPGVVEVNTIGGELKTYEVEVDPERLRAHDLALEDLFTALEENNDAAGGGSIARGGEGVVVRGDARFASIDDIADVLVSTNEEGVSVRVRDLGHVHLAPMLRKGAATRDGHGEAVIGITMLLVGANGRTVVEAARERLDALAPSLPSGVTVDVFYDRAELVDSTIETVAENLGTGALIVVGVLFLLLGSVRGGLIVAAAIPFAMLVAFLGMNALGLSGNLMSLGAIDFGIVVDGSIIVVENAVVHLAAAIHGRAQPMGYREAAAVVLRSTLEVRKAATFGEAIIVLVYVPILTLAGIEGRMFRPMAITVLFALLGAFVASLTFVPPLVATLLRNNASHAEPFLVRIIQRTYPAVLERTLKHPALVLGASAAVLVATGVIASRMGAEFVPRLDEGSLAMQIVRLPSVNLDESIAGSTRVESILLELPEVETVMCRTGRAEVATDPMGVELSDCMIMLRPRDEWTTAHDREGLVSAMQARLENGVPGLWFAFSQPIELRFAELISGSRADVAITIYGDDLRTLDSLSQQIQRIVRRVQGSADVRGEQLAGLSTLDVTVDRDEASAYGVTARSILDVVATIGGRASGEVVEGQRRFGLQVRLPEDLRSNLERLRMLPVRGRSGRLVALGQVAAIEVRDSPASISREAIRRRTTVEVNVRGRDLAGFVAEAQAAVERELPSHPGYTLRWGGQFENLAEASARLAVAVPAALALIFVLLFMAFGALRPAFVIFLNVPFAAVGGVLLLAVRGLPFSISAGVGFIALFGIAVLNGVVLLTTVERRLAEGKPPNEAVRDAALSRLRAVVMTAAVAALGFLPMAISSGSGGEVQRPLATVVVGGLISATFLTLFVLPTLYAWISRRWPAERDEPDPTATEGPTEAPEGHS